MADRKQVRPLGDEDRMPFGAHKGKRMVDLPADYLDWSHGQKWVKNWPQVLGYIENNRNIIDAELKEQGKIT